MAFLGIKAVTHCDPPEQSELQAGDIVFQLTSTRRAPLIEVTTLSQKTHCGIVVEKKGKLYVLEAISTVQLTPLDKWINRSKDGKWWAKRYQDIPFNAKYKEYVGASYDNAFKFGNKQWYCSELVYDIYKRQLGVELCKPKLMSDYHVTGLKKVKAEMQRRGIQPGQLMVAPVDIYNSTLLHDIRLQQETINSNQFQAGTSASIKSTLFIYSQKRNFNTILFVIYIYFA